MLYTKIFKLMNQNKVWKRNLNLFEKQKQPRAQKMHAMKYNPINLLFR
jgi:hypothetical protein